MYILNWNMHTVLLLHIVQKEFMKMVKKFLFKHFCTPMYVAAGLLLPVEKMARSR